MQNQKQDKRFAHIANDPRFAQMPVKRKKVALDSRFNKMLKDDKFKIKAKFNKYGQKQVSNLTQDQQLQRLYRVDQDKRNQGVNKPKAFQWNEVSSSQQSSQSQQESDLDPEQIVKMQEYTKLWNNMQEDAQILPQGGETNRFAVENLNWDMFNSTDLFKLFSSFCKPGMLIQRVVIYPTKIGKESMENDQLYGPQGIFNREEKKKNIKKKQNKQRTEKLTYKDAVIKDTFQPTDQTVERTFDINALRSYQINKMRYFFALVICDSIQTAIHIVNQCNGLEMQLSACFLDLRFVPNDLLQFPYEPRDQCSNLPDSYETKSGMMNRALNHSKVELTWDQDLADTKKSQIITKIACRKVEDLVQDQEIDDQLKDLIAISSEQEANDSNGDGQDDDKEQKSYETKRSMLRDLLKASNLKDSRFDKQYRDRGEKQIEIKFKSAFNDRDQQSEDDGDFLVKKSNSSVMMPPSVKYKRKQSIEQDKLPSQNKKKLNFKQYKEKKKQIRREKKRQQKLQKFKKHGKIDAQRNQVKQLELLVDEGGTKRLQDFQSDANDARFEAMFKESNFQIDPTKAQSQKISDNFKQKQRDFLNT